MCENDSAVDGIIRVLVDGGPGKLVDLIEAIKDIKEDPNKKFIKVEQCFSDSREFYVYYSKIRAGHYYD